MSGPNTSPTAARPADVPDIGAGVDTGAVIAVAWHPDALTPLDAVCSAPADAGEGAPDA